eukprot:6360446-Prymnesium_polylepis.1
MAVAARLCCTRSCAHKHEHSRSMSSHACFAPVLSPLFRIYCISHTFSPVNTPGPPAPGPGPILLRLLDAQFPPPRLVPAPSRKLSLLRYIRRLMDLVVTGCDAAEPSTIFVCASNVKHNRAASRSRCGPNIFCHRPCFVAVAVAHEER